MGSCPGEVGSRSLEAAIRSGQRFYWNRGKDLWLETGRDGSIVYGGIFGFTIKSLKPTTHKTTKVKTNRQRDSLKKYIDIEQYMDVG